MSEDGDVGNEDEWHGDNADEQMPEKSLLSLLCGVVRPVALGQPDDEWEDEWREKDTEVGKASKRVIFARVSWWTPVWVGTRVGRGHRGRCPRCPIGAGARGWRRRHA